MPTTYTTCSDDVTDLLDSVLDRWHKDLVGAGLTVNLLFANNDTSDAVTLHGYPALAVIKINSLKDRVEGKSDCTLTIDEKAWLEMDEAGKLSLLDHEAEHVLLARSKKSGKVKIDDAGRPKLKLRKHDLVLGGFFSIIERHKTSAHEWQDLRKIQERMVQLELPFPTPDSAAYA